MIIETDDTPLIGVKGSGSIVIPTISLMQLLENEKDIFRSNISRPSKQYCMGRIALLTDLLKGIDIIYRWNTHIDIHSLYPNRWCSFWILIEWQYIKGEL